MLSGGTEEVVLSFRHVYCKYFTLYSLLTPSIRGCLSSNAFARSSGSSGSCSTGDPLPKGRSNPLNITPHVSRNTTSEKPDTARMELRDRKRSRDSRCPRPCDEVAGPDEDAVGSNLSVSLGS